MPPLSRSSGSRLPERGLGKEGGVGEQRGLRRFGAPCIFSIWRTPLVTESMVHWAMKEPICSPPRDRPQDLASRRTAGKSKEGKQIKSISTSRFFFLYVSFFIVIKFDSKLETMARWCGFAGLRGATCGRTEVVDRKPAVTPWSVKTLSSGEGCRS